MPEPKILLLATAQNSAEAIASVELLQSITLPGAVKYLAANGKIDAHDVAKTFNVETGYPADPPRLETLRAWAETSDDRDARLRDGYDLFCLRNLVARTEPFDYAILMREGAGQNDDWAAVVAKLSDSLFLPLPRSSPVPAEGGPAESILFNLADERCSGFLDLAWELYVTGAVYGMSPYDFHGALMTAADAQQIEQQIR